MKTSIALLTLTIVAGMSAICQSVKVPEAVTKAFSYKFPNATDVKWGKENSKEYEAEFKLNNTDVSANFRSDGDWVETETTISASDLPPVVNTAIMTKYPGAIFSRTERIEKPGNKIFYEAVIKKNGRRKEIELNADGSFVQ